MGDGDAEQSSLHVHQVVDGRVGQEWGEHDLEVDQDDHRDRPLAHQGGESETHKEADRGGQPDPHPALTISEIDGDKNRPE